MKKILFTLTYCLFYSLIYSQSNVEMKSNDFNLWVDGGVHTCFIFKSSSMQGVQLSQNIAIKNLFYFQINERYSIHIWPSGKKEPNVMEKMEGVSLMWGVNVLPSASMAFVCSIGVIGGNAKFRGERRIINPTSSGPAQPEYEYDNYSYLGVPISFKLMQKNNKMTSIDYYFILSEQHSSMGLAVNLKLF